MKKNIWRETLKMKMDGTGIPRTIRNTGKLVYDDGFLHVDNTGQHKKITKLRVIRYWRKGCRSVERQIRRI